MSLPPAYTGFAFPGVENLHHDIYPAIDASKTPYLIQEGKVVLVTGAGRGIGRAIALQYAHAGVASLIISARTGSDLDEVESSIKKINQEIRVVKLQLDIVNDEEVKKGAGLVAEKEGRLDVLVNNAGHTARWVPMVEVEPADWWRTLEVNLKGPFLMLHYFLPLMASTTKKHNTAAHVVNISSVGSHQLNEIASAYNVSKIALNRLTELVQTGYEGQGIIPYAIHPGGVVTSLTQQEMDILRPYLNDTPDLAGGFTVWLTAEARTWLSGRYTSVTWDVDALEKLRGEIVEGDKLKMRMVV